MADLSRFLKAHENNYQQALSEIKSGQKKSHWMWYIFPQLAGLGHSETARFYGIINLTEAEEFLKHPVLGKNLIEISEVLLALEECDPHVIFGSPDDLKLKSCMTLFSLVSHSNPVFTNVLMKFFDGDDDQATIMLLQNG
jgi:uncharacterized protein (DUF1810 family)